MQSPTYSDFYFKLVLLKQSHALVLLLTLNKFSKYKFEIAGLCFVLPNV